MSNHQQSKSTQPKVILHVDINSYFATLLQQENPHLRGRPVGVVKDRGRTCIIAASKEAKAQGVKTGSRLIAAQQLCPHLIVVPAAFDRYLDATRRLSRLFLNFSPHVYVYSLDEAFIDITDCQRYLYPDPIQAARQIQSQIKQELGDWVTCNVGIAENRFLAKMASEVAAKGSVNQVTTDNKDALLASTPFQDVCGIGHRLEKKLRLFGATVPYHLRLLDPQDLQAVVGPFWTQELLKMAYGQEPHHLELLDRSLPHMQSVGRSITGYRLYDDEAEIAAILRNLMEEITYKVRKMNLAGRQVWVGLYGHSQAWSAHLTLKDYIRHTPQLFEVGYHQLYRHWQRTFPIIKFAVRLNLLKPITQVPQPLFGSWHTQEKLAQASDAITAKYGLFTLRPASLTNRPVIRPEVTGFLGDKTYYGL